MRLLLYCTKQPHKLFNTDKGFVLSDFGLGDAYKDKTLLNGKIVAECDFKVEEIKRINTIGDWFMYGNQNEILEQAKLKFEDFIKYLNGKNGYAIHIKNLHIFDKPRELNEFSYYSAFGYLIKDMAGITNGNGVDRAPQNMMRVMDEKDIYFLISIHPEWLWKILNGKKTIEIRKKVLKEMLENE